MRRWSSSPPAPRCWWWRLPCRRPTTSISAPRRPPGSLSGQVLGIVRSPTSVTQIASQAFDGEVSLAGEHAAYLVG